MILGIYLMQEQIQAEYHSWICLKEYEEEFLVQSLISIKKECKPKKWKWGWLPAGANISWFDSDLLKENVFISIRQS